MIRWRPATVLIALGLATLPGSAGAREATLDRVLRDPRIVESSGLARSTFARDVLWTHNDSGDTARVFAVGGNGQTRAVIRLRCATALDWEDISSGPRHTIWVADIGNNALARTTVTVYRFREPRKLESGSVRCRPFVLSYPRSPFNAEALFVHPRTGRVWVASKVSDGGDIYRAPAELSPTAPNELTRLRDAPRYVTAGTWAPSGKRFALSTGADAYLYRAGNLRLLRRIRLPATEQGESLTFTRDGRALLRGSERRQSPVWRVPLR